MFVDSHVNLHGEAYSDDLDEVMTRARETPMMIWATFLSEKWPKEDFQPYYTVTHQAKDWHGALLKWGFSFQCLE